MGQDLLLTMQRVRAEMGDDANKGADKLQEYDLETLLKLGIAGWSYKDAGADGVVRGVPVTEETIRLLDPVTAEWTGRQIIGAPETDSDRKNDSGGSTLPSVAEASRPTSG